MQVKQLFVKNFRNAEESLLRFCDGTNVICGKNAAGKTNLLEAIFYFAAGKSFRNCHDRELIRFGCESAEAVLDFSTGTVQKRLSARITPSGKRAIRLGESSPLRLSEYMGLFRAVVFTPDHLSLVKGAPLCRRRFLDIAICQSFPRYAGILSEYNRVIAQKNAGLKKRMLSDELLTVYNEKAASLAALITVNRKKYLSRLEAVARDFLTELSSGTETLELVCQSQSGDADTKEELQEKYFSVFESHREQEREKALCLYGAHKDDFLIQINKKNTRFYGSQGQQRSCVLALKLAEGELSAALTGEYPVFLLDDVLSELDSRRQEFVLSRLAGKQVIITGCDEGLFDSPGNVIRIEEGRVCTSS